MAPNNNALRWFRRDLRLSDNPALQAATEWARERGGSVLPVYIASDTEAGAWKDGAASRWWLHHSLTALSQTLNARGSRLVVRTGATLEVLKDVVSEAGIGAVFWNRLYEPASIERDRVVKAALREHGLHVASSNAALLHEPWTIKTRTGGPYKVFTPFSRTLSALPTPAPIAGPEVLPAPPSQVTGLALNDLHLLPSIPWDGGMRDAWEPGESGARTLLDDFIEAPVADYPQARDFPDRAGTSRLSAALHFGEISPRQAWFAARAAQPEVSGPWLRQLQWREFAHHQLFHFPRTPDQPLDPRYATFSWRSDYQADLRAWQRGQTGIPIVDAGMRELWHTGWMHNRVRMLVASLLTKNLLIPWQEGARWFWDTLVDADLANNTLGWQWTAGCGADAAPYFRVFNPATQGLKFDPDGRYVRRWVPELKRLPDKWLQQPWTAPAEVLRGCGVRLGRDYPMPIVDLAESRRIALEIWANEVRHKP